MTQFFHPCLAAGLATIPIDLKFEEMQPGDLIFYSGIYFNTKCRQQKHNMVHVEVFTGGETGE